MHEAVTDDAAAVIRSRREQRVPRVEADLTNGAAVLPSEAHTSITSCSNALWRVSEPLWRESANRERRIDVQLAKLITT